ncbi:MAG: asparaginase [Myxococcota bacterium]
MKQFAVAFGVLALAVGAWPTGGLVEAAALHSVVVVTTGGTIAEKTDPKTGAAVPAVSGKDLIAAVPGLSKIANVVVVEYSNIDSSQMTPDLWAGLSRRVDQLLDGQRFVGAVVTHGTDTMAEGAYFLDITLRTNKPVVFTGAMNDASTPDPDGPGNLYNAVVQVLSPNAQNWGVTVTLDRYINSAADVRKTQTTNVMTFESGEKGYLGYVFDGKVTRINDRVRRTRIPLPAVSPQTNSQKLPNVPFVYAYSGADGSIVRAALASGAKGLVVEGVGAGNVNAAVDDVIVEALAKKIPVVISTRPPLGAAEPIYGDKGGGATLVRQGATLAGALEGAKARLLLIVALARFGNDTKEIKRVFAEVRGAP